MVSLHRTLIIFICTAIIGIASTTQAASYHSAINAYERGDYHTAFRQFNKLSNQNDPYAQYMLGRMYMTGEGVGKDHILAFKWVSLAADKGVAPAKELKRQIRPYLSKQDKRWAKELIADHRHLKSQTADFVEYTDPVTIRRVQNQLAQLGFFHATVDGIMGKKTRRAIRHYQETRNLDVDGRITIALLENLYRGINTLQGSHHRQPHGRENACDTKLRQRLKKLIAKGYEKHAAETWYLHRLEELLQTSWSL